MSPRALLELGRQTLRSWGQDKASRLAAALAYYALFSLAPLLVVLILVVGLVLGPEAAQGQLVGPLEGFVGAQAASLIQNMVEAAGRQRTGGVLASVLGLGALLFGAVGFFAALQDSLNTVWGIAPRPSTGLVDTIRTLVIGRAISFVAVLGIGLIAIASFLATAVLSAIAGWFGELAPGLSAGWFLVNILVSLAVLTVLFAFLLRVLPEAEIAWSDVWLGAAVTALLFVIGKELIGLYLGRASVGSVYGAAGSLVVLLVWIYYSAQILLLGAEFTHAYANMYGSRVRPGPRAVWMPGQGPPKKAVPPQPAPVARVEETRRGWRSVVAGAGPLLLFGALLGWLLGSRRGRGRDDT